MQISWKRLHLYENNEFSLKNLEIPQASLFWSPNWADCQASWEWQELHKGLAWEQHHITLFGRQVTCPRLSAWYGDEGTSYTYSGLRLEPLPWTPLLRHLQEKLQKSLGFRFNSVLANLYRNGQDAMGWHSDDEPELGEQPVIASLSFGATRRFSLRHRHRLFPSHHLELCHGSLLLMAGTTQQHWQHQLPRTKKQVGPRINLTFRWIHI